jgi:hypothetical protein
MDEPLDPALMPRCEGEAPPAPDDTSPTAEMKRAFLAAYYQINVLSRRLSTVRAKPPSTARAAAEREVLQAIERAILARDALEDEHAVAGIIGQPTFENGVVTDIHFTFPGRRYGGMSSTTMCFAVAPEGPLPIEPGA